MRRVRRRQTRGLAAAAGLVLSCFGIAPAAAQIAHDDELVPPAVRLSIAQGSGARALGMGGAFLARPDDATAASWNPAGLSYLLHPEVSVAGVFGTGRTLGYLGDTLDNDDRLEMMSPDFAAAAFPFETEWMSGAAQISYQRAISFAGERRILRGGRQIELDTKGGFDNIAAGLGFRLSPKLRWGVTVNRWVNGHEANFARLNPRPEVRETDLSLNGWSMNAGLIWTPIESLNLGLVGKTPFDAQVSLWRRRRDFDNPVLPPRKEAFRTGLSLRFPGAVGFGASWRVSSPLTVSVDYTRTFWSDAVVRNYFELTALGDVLPFERLPYPFTAAPEQQDTEQIRAGLEYVFLFGDVKVPVRVGYYNDRQYFREDDGDMSPERSELRFDGGTPRFHAVTAGLGVAVGPVIFDVAYVREHGRYLDSVQRIPTDSSMLAQYYYRSTSNRLFVSLIYRYSRR